MSQGDWVREFPAEIMRCDPHGIVLEMNKQAESLFAADGGEKLLGSSLLDCHPQPALQKLVSMLAHPSSNSYFSTEQGVKRFFHQCPWYLAGTFAGLVEISFEVPETIPNFIRS